MVCNIYFLGHGVQTNIIGSDEGVRVQENSDEGEAKSDEETGK